MQNTLITISDNKIGTDTNADNLADFYTASVLSATDYYAFGMSMKGRSWQSEKYRYGFNGQERDRDIREDGNHTTAEFWEYSAVVGRRWNIDPVVKEHESPYAVFANSPINFIDLSGADTTRSVNNTKKLQTTNNVKGSMDEATNQRMKMLVKDVNNPETARLKGVAEEIAIKERSNINPFIEVTGNIDKYGINFIATTLYVYEKKIIKYVSSDYSTNKNMFNLSNSLKKYGIDVQAKDIRKFLKNNHKTITKSTKNVAFVGVIAAGSVSLYEMSNDKWNAHTVADVGFTIAGATAIVLVAAGTAPVTASALATAGLVYGIADIFGVADVIDAKMGRGTEFGNKFGEHYDNLKKNFFGPK